MTSQLQNNFSFPRPAERMKFDGERFVTGQSGQIKSEHYHRYLFAARLCENKRVLDVACGEGYGSFLLSQFAANVAAVDRDSKAINFARQQYALPNLTFILSDARHVSLPDQSVDVVTSFETIEHLEDPKSFLLELKRVLRPNGLLIISSPNRPVYNEMNQRKNPFHFEEYDRDEFSQELSALFANVNLFCQRAFDGSVIAQDGGISNSIDSFASEDGFDFSLSHGIPFSPYFIAVAANSDIPDITTSLYFDSSIGTAAKAEWDLRDEQLRSVAQKLDTTTFELDTKTEQLQKIGLELAQRERDLSTEKERATSFASKNNLLEAELRRTAQAMNSMRRELAASNDLAKALRLETEAVMGHLKCRDTALVAATGKIHDLENQLSQLWQKKIATLVTKSRNATKLMAFVRHPSNPDKRKLYRSRHYCGPRREERESHRASSMQVVPRHPWALHGSRTSRTAQVSDPSADSANGPVLPIQLAQSAPRGEETLYERYVGNAMAWHQDAQHCSIAEQPIELAKGETKVVAYYLPQFHPTPENDKFWGKGFTEWRNVARAFPVFEGHNQPRVPGELGYYDLRVTETMRRQAELAKLYGISAFCFHFYWFAGKRLLELPLENLLKSTDIDIEFSLCWANENWSRRWDGGNNELLMAQRHSPEDDIAFIKYVSRYFSDPRYLKVEGKPVLTVYRPAILPDARATTQRWRREARKMGFPGLYLIATNTFNFTDYRDFGFDALAEFPPNFGELERIDKSIEFSPYRKGGATFSYESVVERELKKPSQVGVVHPGAMPGWDNSARRPHDATIFHGATPQLFRKWIENGFRRASANPAGENFLFINAWNEWAEGAYLEPDAKFGYAWLQAVRDARTQLTANRRPRKRLVIVSHDGHPHGGQYLALRLAREAVSLGFIPETIFLESGPLVPQFEKLGPVHFINPSRDSDQSVQTRLQEIRSRASELAIVNTTVSGALLPFLKIAGFRTLTLVHELPGILESYKLTAEATAIAYHSDDVVFPAREVKSGFEKFSHQTLENAIIRPQGLISNILSPSAEPSSVTKSRIRERLNLAKDTQIILGVAYGDHRKGFDLFIDACIQVLNADRNVVAVWIGRHDQSLLDAQLKKIADAQLESRFVFPGHVEGLEPYYIAADLFLLSSREDPFPNVVLDSLGAKVPVIAFEGGGGFTGLLSEGAGILVPAFDTTAMANAALRLLKSPAVAEELGRKGHELVSRNHNFSEYFRDLLVLGGNAPKSVTAIVPSYNYAKYIVDRLQTIVDQTVLPFELIILDDASSDESVASIREFLATCRIPAKLVVNEQNSGSVFHQWRRGIDLAQGEIVWIAEADDLCHRDFISELLPAFASPDVVMAYCESMQIDAEGAILAHDYRAYVADIDADRWRTSYRNDGKSEISEALFLKNTIPNVSAALFRRSSLQEVFAQHSEEITSLRHAGDWATYIRVLEKGSIAYSCKSLNSHRRHGQSLTLANNGGALLREILHVQRETLSRFRLPRSSLDRANAYAQQLYVQFGLCSDQNPTFETHPEIFMQRRAA